MKKKTREKEGKGKEGGMKKKEQPKNESSGTSRKDHFAPLEQEHTTL